MTTAAWIVALMLVCVPVAMAHPEATSPGPGLHKICAAIGVCHDPAPRPGPRQDCTPANKNLTIQVWDERLGAYVEWICQCDEPHGCRWFRLRIVERQLLPWDRYRHRFVWDKQRACDSIVCLTEYVLHRYPTKWRFG